MRPGLHIANNLEGDFSADEVEFGSAMERYKRVNGRPWPGWSEALGVVLALGYRRAVADEEAPCPATLPLTRVQRAAARGIKIMRRPQAA